MNKRKKKNKVRKFYEISFTNQLLVAEEEEQEEMEEDDEVWGVMKVVEVCILFISY